MSCPKGLILTALLVGALAFPPVFACTTTMSVAEVQNLGFGEFTPNSAGTVTVDTSGARVGGGGVYLLGGTWGQSIINVNGDANCSFSISLPTSVSLSNGAQSMMLDSFVSSPAVTGTLDGSGYQQLNIGATLHVPGGQQAGDYTGFFTVTVSYN